MARRFIKVCQFLSQSMLAAKQSTPMKEAAVFSYRVATARHSFSRAQRRSTRLRLLWIHGGQAIRSSLRLGGISGRAPHPQIGSRNAWLA